LICIVCSWSATTGEGGGVMVWPSAGTPVALVPQSFVGYRVPPPLAPGDKITFGCVSPEGAVMYADRWVIPTVAADDKTKVDRAPDVDWCPNCAVSLVGPVEVPPPRWGFAPTPWMAPRRCLWCRRTFLSTGPAERFCPRCRPAENGA